MGPEWPSSRFKGLASILHGPYAEKFSFRIPSRHSVTESVGNRGSSRSLGLGLLTAGVGNLMPERLCVGTNPPMPLKGRTIQGG